ncbi:hypothetical protein [uncultured Gammaproteobacteria bacterium]|nr:hypothetical protein [uncultured Gammaproteobacteria bacterium]
MNSNSEFNFNISLSVLNHLGRNLYRSFITVIGEAISNSWDADAKNVWITINRDENYFVIKDDGIGMSKKDFQEKFLKIGYSKRKEGALKSPNGRPFIGRKGIGKLALLSCAKKVSIITKTSGSSYVGGVIDNNQLDKDITDDMKPQDSKLGEVKEKIFLDYQEGHEKGTIIYFEDIHEGIKNRLNYIKILMALYFRFSLVDQDFNIYVNGEKITVEKLKSLADKTQFLWKINELEDPYFELLKNLKENEKIESELLVKGFITSVEKPSYLNIHNSDEKVGIDLYVNGRLREKNILSHFSTLSTRVVTSYLYGQIHFDQLDSQDEDDKFTTSREGVKEGDADFKILLDELKPILKKISNQWDEWRIKNRQEGDNENERKTPKQRAVMSLVNKTADEYTPPKDSKNKTKIDKWLEDLNADAQFNISSYTDCFVSENLIREYIKDKKIESSDEAKKIVNKFKEREEKAKNKGNISIDIMENNEDLSYLSMDDLANLFDKRNNDSASLSRDAMEYKPMRNAVAHTARLTEAAKHKLASVYENIKGRLKTLLFND